MPSLQTLLLFLAADLALKLTPGPDMALTLTRGMTQGFRIAWLSVLGTWSAGFVQIPLVVLGLAALFQHSPLLFSAVKILGALYLVYLGARALRRCARPAAGLAAGTQAGSARDAYWQGLFTNLLNPKVFLFLVAFLPQFTDPARGPVWLQMLLLALVSKMLGLGTGACFAYGASRIRGWLMRNPWFLRLQEGLLGAAMLGIAGWLLLNRDPLPGR
ncbi:LysE family translocator [Bordetella hinzii]|uniref:LysE family translocator n=1 Tax=Bordetella hinzii TaxID=103855 RepID=UPI000459D878|nr:LysE family translocator [Bordetella hinzii]AKQ61170.1 Homoserine/homoserine lactone efflux protein [Bordetella hinzii]KCB31430.1 translocator protein, LysE family [Bordetella hinzii CA90 BAL1384]MBZ0075810.1 LysE family translocator [Bordetella hinzii]MBZ0080914.1 LysE family translocator [Bordetella hinzii]MBZ0085319.1 LysE family translocator [Bordetella hinzii]